MGPLLSHLFAVPFRGNSEDGDADHQAQNGGKPARSKFLKQPRHQKYGHCTENSADDDIGGRQWM